MSETTSIEPTASESNQMPYSELNARFVMPTYSGDILFVCGEGARLWDDAGRCYLDFGCGISVCNLGHCHPKVVEAIRMQCGKLMHVSNLYMNENQPLLAVELSRIVFDGQAFFCNSGAEANEGMFKFARKWGSTRGKHEIVAMEDSFHGRTLATLAATGRSKYRVGFQPDMPGFRHVPFNDVEALDKAVVQQTAAVVMEPIQGEGGVIPAAPGYLDAARSICDKRGALLLFDEVQSGMGRTGEFFALKTFSAKPDVLSMAKALGNGFPIGAFIARRELGPVLTAGVHASTFGGNPLACAAGLATIHAMEEEGILENVRRMGALLMERLNALKAEQPLVKAVRGVGLMVGVALHCVPQALCAAARAEGLLLIPAGEDAVRVYPPLNVTEAEIDEGVLKLTSALRKIQEGNKK